MHRAKSTQYRRAKKMKASEDKDSPDRDEGERNHSDDSSDDDESLLQRTLQAKCILTEYWGPRTRGRARFSQRLFDVLFSDGSQHTLVAEDVVDGWDEPFESNPFTRMCCDSGARPIRTSLYGLCRIYC